MNQIHQTDAAKIIPGLGDTQIQLSRINRFLLFALSVLVLLTEKGIPRLYCRLNTDCKGRSSTNRIVELLKMLNSESDFSRKTSLSSESS